MNNNPTTQEAGKYVEPEGFKGTTGEWCISPNGYDIETVETDPRGICILYANFKPDYNAILISQAKEMAKALQAIISAKDKALSTQDLFHVLQEIDKSRTILQKAIPTTKK